MHPQRFFGEELLSHNKIEYPELLFCLVSPIGVNLDLITESLEEELRSYGYSSKNIHLTDIFKSFPNYVEIKHNSLSDKVKSLISKGNDLREKYGADVMARLGIFQIRQERKQSSEGSNKALEKVAYIVRQFKRPEEIQLFRKIYGERVYQISAYSNIETRIDRLSSKMLEYDSYDIRTSSFEEEARKLINQDSFEEFVEYGQRVRDIFPLADVFIDSSSTESTKKNINRFMEIAFGSNSHSPNHDEYGMYMAKSAALRSLDLSRQVGAAIFTCTGEVKALGCNEVPKPGGGTYWEGDKHDAREFYKGRDTNEDYKNRLFADIIKNLVQTGIVEEKYENLNATEFIEKVKIEKKVDLSKKILLMDITEYGRIVHAEMNAITDAARNGISIKDSILFCTTFPCHVCAKHIISAGLKRVVYIEPYPKSYTSELYKNDIKLTRDENLEHDVVYFEPFIGISPYRYQYFFERKKRKDSSTGKIMRWKSGVPMPLVEVYDTEYTNIELEYLRELIGRFADSGFLIKNEAESM